MKKIVLLILLYFPPISFGNDFAQQQEQTIQQQQIYVIEDLLFEIDYLEKQVEQKTANEYEVFKLKKLKNRLEKIQDNNGLNY